MLICNNCANCGCDIIKSKVTLFCKISGEDIDDIVLEGNCENYIEEIVCDFCKVEPPTYEYEEELFCPSCLLERLKNANKIQTWSIEHFMVDGEYMGNEEDNEIEEIAEDIANWLDIKKVVKDHESI